MKVLLLTTHLDIGGVGVYTVNLARYLKKEGVDVAVMSSGGELVGRLEKEGVRHIKADIKTKSEIGVKVWRVLPLLTRLIKEDGFRLIHAQTRVAQVLAHLAGKITGVPYVSTCHGFFKHRRLFRRILPCWGKKVIAISDSVRGHLLDDFHLDPGCVERVYNGIELEQYPPAGDVKDSDLMRSVGLAEDVTIVGSVGRLSSVKGYKYLISAFKDIISKGRAVQLLIVGDGPEKNALQKQVRELGLEKSVFLTPGGMPPQKYLALMDVFCLPSVHEGLGLSLMEAMAMGRACVASDVGGLSELIVNDTDGILVPSKDPEALARAISRLVEDPRLRQTLGESARAKAVSNFSIKDSVARTIEVYRGVLGETRKVVGSR